MREITQKQIDFQQRRVYRLRKEFDRAFSEWIRQSSKLSDMKKAIRK